MGNAGGGWPGIFEDIVNGYRFISQNANRHNLDSQRMAVTGHSAGGQLALCLAARETSVKNVVSLAGVVDLQQAWELHLSNNAVVDFLGGKPDEVPEHYQEADPMRLKIPKAVQWLIHGLADDVVPANLSREYVQQKKANGEDVHLLEIAAARHFDVSLAQGRANHPAPDSSLVRIRTRCRRGRPRPCYFCGLLRSAAIKRSSSAPAPNSLTQTQCNCRSHVRRQLSAPPQARNPDHIPHPASPD